MLCKIKIKIAYHEDEGFSLKNCCFVALAFLPFDDVVGGFEELMGDDDIPLSFLSCFTNDYIGPPRGGGQER